MEDLLHGWRDGSLVPGPDALDLLARANDLLSAQVDALVAHQEIPSGEEIGGRIRSVCHPGGPPRGTPPAAAGAAPPVGTTVAPSAPGGDTRPRLLVDLAIRQGAPLPGARAMVILKRLEEHREGLE